MGNLQRVTRYSCKNILAVTPPGVSQKSDQTSEHQSICRRPDKEPGPTSPCLLYYLLYEVFFSEIPISVLIPNDQTILISISKCQTRMHPLQKLLLW
jgi:hypothetical protein